VLTTFRSFFGQDAEIQAFIKKGRFDKLEWVDFSDGDSLYEVCIYANLLKCLNFVRSSANLWRCCATG